MSLPSRIGRYEVVAALAAGGMAEILLGRLVGPSGFESTVVIKRILPHLARLKSFVAMFLDEARIASRIRHPNVVFVQELGSDGEDLYLVMEYLAGETASALKRALAASPETLRPEIAAHIVAEACAGLHAAHELTDSEGKGLELVHRDVSPQNLFITYEGQVKVLDFGIAKVADRISKTEAGLLKGKFDYMAPEQCRGQELDRRADIFALGIVLYELTTGRRLFKRANELATLKAITEEPIIPPSRVAVGYPQRLEKVCMKALARNKADRYATAMDMRKELLGAIRELRAPGTEPEEAGLALGTLMRTVFEDRVEAKREMLRRVRSGSAVTTVPTDDELIDLSPASRTGGGAALSADPVSGSVALRESGRPKRRTLGLFVVLGIVGLTGGALAVARARAPSSGAAPTVAGTVLEPPSSPSSGGSDASAPPSQPSAVMVHLETVPPGARVLVKGTERGITPFDLELPRGAEAYEVELRRQGYATVMQRVTADVDQRLLLSLQAVAQERPPARKRAPTPLAAPTTPSSSAPAEYPKF